MLGKLGVKRYYVLVIRSGHYGVGLVLLCGLCDALSSRGTLEFGCCWYMG